MKKKPQENNEIKEPEPEKSGRIKTTLEEYGDRLPIGIMHDGSVYKDIVTKPWRTKDERELGKKIPPDAGMAEHVSTIVANMCSRLGPHEMDKLSDGRKALVVSMMYMCDVFYVYTLLRVKAMGPKLKTMITCPRPGCNVEFPYVGNLNTLEVSTVENINDIIWEYKLQDPIEIRKKLVTSFKMGYAKWNMLESNSGNTNVPEVKTYTILDSILGINDEEEYSPLIIDDLDELSRRDFQGLIEGINENFLGPNMSIEGQCSPEVCKKFHRGGHKFMLPIDWRYENFFGSSSQ